MRMPRRVRATTREQFCLTLLAAPLERADALVVLCGEDADARAECALEIVRMGGAPVVVLSGGVDHPPSHVGARRLATKMIDAGVAHDRILLEEASQHTHEQAVAVVAMAAREGWSSLMLIASAYHLPRAYLTFLVVVQETGRTDLQLCIATALQASWFHPPLGVDATRLDLLASEYAKITAYGPHVASYREGLAELRRWETVA